MGKLNKKLARLVCDLCTENQALKRDIQNARNLLACNRNSASKAGASIRAALEVLEGPVDFEETLGPYLITEREHGRSA